MTMTTGTRLGAYEILSKLGAGGTQALVMELVEGRDLSEIIAAGAQAPALHTSGAPGLQPGGLRRQIGGDVAQERQAIPLALQR